METSLSIMTNASKMLAEATTIQKSKELKDLALTAADWAKRKGMGDETIRYCMSYAFEAERRMGELLKSTERNKGANGILSITSTKRVPVMDDTPTLADLGITKKESSAAQFLAGLPDETFDKIASGETTVNKATKEVKSRQRNEARAEIAKAGAQIPQSDKWHVYHGDIATYQTDKQYDFIITDPPYPREFLPLYGILAERARKWLKPGGLLVTMCGQSYLNDIYILLDGHLNYYWTACYLTPGQATPLWTRQVNTNWKPILIYGLDEKYTGKIFGDVFKSGGNDKDFHKWGQSVSGMLSLISQICLPGQSILDPFCGAGTTGVAALKHGCLFDGIDLLEENVNISRARLAEGANDNAN